MKLPSIFLGSSSEARPIAEEFIIAFKGKATVEPWWRAEDFKTMHSTLEGILAAADNYDFGLFLLTPDDDLTSRDLKTKSARDNVLFELGVFLGKLGPQRTFAVIQRTAAGETPVKVMSDLSGIHMPYFKADDRTTLRDEVNQVVLGSIAPQVAQQERRKPVHREVATGYSFRADEMRFSLTLSAARMHPYQLKLKGKAFLLACRKYDEDTNLEDDPRVVIGKPRPYPVLPFEELVLTVDCAKAVKQVDRGDTVEGHLFLIAGATDLKKVKTVKDLLAVDADYVGSYVRTLNELRGPTPAKTKRPPR